MKRELYQGLPAASFIISQLKVGSLLLRVNYTWIIGVQVLGRAWVVCHGVWLPSRSLHFSLILLWKLPVEWKTA